MWSGFGKNAAAGENKDKNGRENVNYKEYKRQKYKTGDRVWMIPTGDILPNPMQPRKDFSYQKLLELAQSITENGLLHPVTIAFRQGKPVLIAGERRLRAAKIAGLREIPCMERQVDGEQAAILALVENLQREDMNCFEEAEGFRLLIGEYGLTQEEVAQRVGCAQPTIANKLRLLKLSPQLRLKIIEADLTERHARALLRLEDEGMRLLALDRMIQEKMTVAQTDRMVSDLLLGRIKRKRPLPLVRDVRLFFNTVSHAVDTMRRSGIKACAEKSETEEYIEYVVRIPKAEAVSPSGRSRAEIRSDSSPDGKQTA